MTELMHKDIIGERVIDRYRAVQIEDAATAVRAAIRENLDEFVGRELRSLAQPLIIESENVPLRAERVVGRQRVTINSRRRPRNARLICRRTQPPDIEILAMFFKG